MGKRVAPIDWSGVPAQYVGKCSAVCRTLQECQELVRHFGDADFAPFLPVLVMVPGAAAPTAITGLGYATAAELQDCAVVTWETQVGRSLDFDALREKHGLMRREEVDAATREALLQRVAKHKANPISDPPRQPQRPNPTQRRNFVIDKEAPRNA
jgi:hypothetical protein